MRHARQARAPRLIAATALALVVAACGTPGPPPQLYQLPLAAPGAAAPAAAATTAEVWELASDVRLPAYLDRQTLVQQKGGAGLQLLEGHRWAEPLRDTVPRLLQHDLAQLRGADRVWAAPAPGGVNVAKRLQVEVLSLQADAAQVQLQARWQLLDPQGRAAPQLGQAQLQVPVAGAQVDAIVAAHRLLLWQLAQRIAASP